MTNGRFAHQNKRIYYVTSLTLAAGDIRNAFENIKTIKIN